MSNAKKVAVIIAGIFVALLVISFVVGSMINIFIPPSEALFGDKLIEDIGGDNALVATLDGCLEVSEESIPDGNFITQSGQSLSWFDAKNITFVDVYGYKGNMIVWKAPIEKYSILRDVDGGGYISDYINSSDKNCFLVHFSGSDAVYGIILDNENISYPESQLLYTILGLDKSNFPTTYSTSTSYGYYSGGSSHYHTVVPDRDTLAKTDPGAYYDHYEYGDNYDIDDYLESEGYD